MWSCCGVSRVAALEQQQLQRLMHMEFSSVAREARVAALLLSSHSFNPGSKTACAAAAASHSSPQTSLQRTVRTPGLGVENSRFAATRHTALVPQDEQLQQRNKEQPSRQQQHQQDRLQQQHVQQVHAQQLPEKRRLLHLQQPSQQQQFTQQQPDPLQQPGDSSRLGLACALQRRRWSDLHQRIPAAAPGAILAVASATSPSRLFGAGASVSPVAGSAAGHVAARMAASSGGAVATDLAAPAAVAASAAAARCRCLCLAEIHHFVCFFTSAAASPQCRLQRSRSTSGHPTCCSNSSSNVACSSSSGCCCTAVSTGSRPHSSQFNRSSQVQPYERSSNSRCCFEQRCRRRESHLGPTSCISSSTLSNLSGSSSSSGRSAFTECCSRRLTVLSCAAGSRNVSASSTSTGERQKADHLGSGTRSSSSIRDRRRSNSSDEDGSSNSGGDSSSSCTTSSASRCGSSSSSSTRRGSGSHRSSTWESSSSSVRTSSSHGDDGGSRSNFWSSSGIGSSFENSSSGGGWSGKTCVRKSSSSARRSDRGREGSSIRSNTCTGSGSSSGTPSSSSALYSSGCFHWPWGKFEEFTIDSVQQMLAQRQNAAKTTAAAAGAAAVGAAAAEKAAAPRQEVEICPTKEMDEVGAAAVAGGQSPNISRSLHPRRKRSKRGGVFADTGWQAARLEARQRIRSNPPGNAAAADEDEEAAATADAAAAGEATARTTAAAVSEGAGGWAAAEAASTSEGDAGAVNGRAADAELGRSPSFSSILGADAAADGAEDGDGETEERLLFSPIADELLLQVSCPSLDAQQLLYVLGRNSLLLSDAASSAREYLQQQQRQEEAESPCPSCCCKYSVRDSSATHLDSNSLPHLSAQVQQQQQHQQEAHSRQQQHHLPPHLSQQQQQLVPQQQQLQRPQQPQQRHTPLQQQQTEQQRHAPQQQKQQQLQKPQQQEDVIRLSTREGGDGNHPSTACKERASAAGADSGVSSRYCSRVLVCSGSSRIKDSGSRGEEDGGAFSCAVGSTGLHSAGCLNSSSSCSSRNSSSNRNSSNCSSGVENSRGMEDATIVDGGASSTSTQKALEGGTMFPQELAAVETHRSIVAAAEVLQHWEGLLLRLLQLLPEMRPREISRAVQALGYARLPLLRLATQARQKSVAAASPLAAAARAVAATTAAAASPPAAVAPPAAAAARPETAGPCALSARIATGARSDGRATAPTAVLRLAGAAAVCETAIPALAATSPAAGAAVHLAAVSVPSSSCSSSSSPASASSAAAPAAARAVTEREACSRVAEAAARPTAAAAGDAEWGPSLLSFPTARDAYLAAAAWALADQRGTACYLPEAAAAASKTAAAAQRLLSLDAQLVPQLQRQVALRVASFHGECLTRIFYGMVKGGMEHNEQYLDFIASEVLERLEKKLRAWQLQRIFDAAAASPHFPREFLVVLCNRLVSQLAFLPAQSLTAFFPKALELRLLTAAHVRKLNVIAGKRLRAWKDPALLVALGYPLVLLRLITPSNAIALMRALRETLPQLEYPSARGADFNDSSGEAAAERRRGVRRINRLLLPAKLIELSLFIDHPQVYATFSPSLRSWMRRLRQSPVELASFSQYVDQAHVAAPLLEVLPQHFHLHPHLHRVFLLEVADPLCQTCLEWDAPWLFYPPFQQYERKVYSLCKQRCLQHDGWKVLLLSAPEFLKLPPTACKRKWVLQRARQLLEEASLKCLFRFGGQEEQQ